MKRALMKRAWIIVAWAALSLLAIGITHRLTLPLYEWTRVLVLIPVIYAGIHYRREGSIAASIALAFCQVPFVMNLYAISHRDGINYLSGAVALMAAGVYIGHVMRRERDSAETIQWVRGVMESLQRDVGADEILELMERHFKSRGATENVETWLFDEHGALRRRGDPRSPLLPPDHLYYTIAQRGFLVSDFTPDDPRVESTGGDEIHQLAAFPIEYGGRPRGVIALANSADERFGRETVSFLLAIKHAVENALELMETRQAAIRHELQRRRIQNVFSSYVSRSIAEEILKDPDKVDLGGRLLDVTVMFTEVVNFQQLSAALDPADLFSMLNEHFARVIDAILEHEGTIDKFIGDNVMAFWGAPLPRPDSEHGAVACARDIQRRMAELNQSWERRGLPPFHISIGVNTGQVIAGNIGGLRRMEYTVIGDTVNLASRLKTLSKNENLPILVSESTWRRVRDRFQFGDKFQAAVKGKSEAVTVYPLLTTD